MFCSEGSALVVVRSSSSGGGGGYGGVLGAGGGDCGGSGSSFISSKVSEAMRRICFPKAGGVLGRDGCEGSDVRRGPLLCLERRSLRKRSCLGRSIMALCMGYNRPLIVALYMPLVSPETL